MKTKMKIVVDRPPHEVFVDDYVRRKFPLVDKAWKIRLWEWTKDNIHLRKYQWNYWFTIVPAKSRFALRVEKWIDEANWWHRMEEAYYHENPEPTRKMMYSADDGKWIDVSIPF